MADPSAPDKRLHQLAAGSITTLLLGIAGLVNTKQPEVTLWSVFLAGVCVMFAIHMDFNLTLLQTGGIVIALFAASVGVQIWLIAHQDNEEKKAATPPPKVMQTGAATTNAIGSPAVTGTVGAMNITIDGEEITPKNKKNPAQK
jgi:hypothetical protein